MVPQLMKFLLVNANRGDSDFGSICIPNEYYDRMTNFIMYFLFSVQ